LAWLLLLFADVLVEGYRLPFWLNGVGVGVLAYALGLNSADLTMTRLPTRRSALRGLVGDAPSPR
jgi:hypothetical protein